MKIAAAASIPSEIFDMFPPSRGIIALSAVVLLFLATIRLHLFVPLLLGTCAVSPAFARQTPSMSFFVTSAGPGKGGNLGGLLGADRHCQMLATAAGAGNRTWHAYIEASPGRDPGSVNHESALRAQCTKDAKKNELRLLRDCEGLRGNYSRTHQAWHVN